QNNNSIDFKALAWICRGFVFVPSYRHPVEPGDASRVVRFVRANAAKWNIDAKCVGIVGSSACGHLPSSLMTHFDGGDAKSSDAIEQQSSRPDFGILCYPMISMQMNNVTLG